MGLLRRVANRMSRGTGVPNRNQNRSLMMGPPLLGPPPGIEPPPAFNHATFKGPDLQSGSNSSLSNGNSNEREIPKIGHPALEKAIAHHQKLADSHKFHLDRERLMNGMQTSDSYGDSKSVAFEEKLKYLRGMRGTAPGQAWLS